MHQCLRQTGDSWYGTLPTAFGGSGRQALQVCTQSTAPSAIPYVAYFLRPHLSTLHQYCIYNLHSEMRSINLPMSHTCSCLYLLILEWN